MRAKWSAPIRKYWKISEQMMVKYCDLVHTYADNGFTGTRFDRPEFERMIQDVRTGKIQCIVVKDLSRFGRDYIETGSYLETIFPMLHVRFIAINDDFDNIRQSDVDSLAVPIKNMVNSLYAKDISKKISLSYQMRREKGIPTSWCTPYGYQLNQQGNKFEATEDAKWVKLDLSMVSCRSKYKRNCPQVGIFRSSKAERTAESQIT